MNRRVLLAAVLPGLAVAACDGFEDALTGHAKPVAEAAGYRLSTENLGLVMAASPMPDSALTPLWAAEMARLWADYVVVAELYHDPDSTRSLDYTRLLEEGRHLGALSVRRYRDSVVLTGIEPTEEELRELWDVTQPFTRLDVRRIVLTVDAEASDATLDSLYDVARRIRERLVGGADFVQAAREASDEPAQARGQVIAYQGHDDFPPAADSILFRLQPGAISPVIVTEGQVLIYRIEERRTPDYETARDQLRERVMLEREETRETEALDSLVGDARRSVMRGAPDLARQVAADRTMASDRVSGGLRLVTWDGGELIVDELRRVFTVRKDLQDLFADATDEELEDYLMQLARDEILMSAAAQSGVAATDEDAAALSVALADQLGRLAARLQITSEAVANPAFDVQQQSMWFLQGVLERAQALPWLGEFRIVLDPVFRVRVDEGGAEIAARRARELRAAGFGSPEAADEADEEPEPLVEVG